MDNFSDAMLSPTLLPRSNYDMNRSFINNPRTFKFEAVPHIARGYSRNAGTANS